jgi:YegS/Rv2252/BmrU family lipid kinase
MKCLLVYNPYSKSRRVTRHFEYIFKRLNKKYETVDTYCTHGPRSITEYVYNNHQNYDLIVVCGGDGTINEAMTGLVKAKSRTTLGVIPTGTCNDLSKMLNFSKNIKKQLSTILHGVVVKMDICKMNDNYFSYGCAIGKYTDVSYKAKRPIKRLFGRLAYFLAGLSEFVKYTKLDLIVKVNNQVINNRFYVVLALNANRVAGFNIKRIKDVKLNDGVIDLTLIEKNEHFITWPRLAKFFITGDKAKKGVTNIRTNHIEIDSYEDLNINTDGELAEKTNKVTIDVIKQALNIIVSNEIKKKFF